MYSKKGTKLISKITTIQSKTKAAMNSSRPVSSTQKAPTKMKKNPSENAFIKTKITNLEQNLNDQERLLKDILVKVTDKDVARRNTDSKLSLKSNMVNKDNAKLIEIYEVEIAGLKKNMDNLMQENAYYKRVLDNNSKSNERDADYEKELLRKKIADLEQVIKQKELLIDEKDNAYRLQINTFNERILEFQKLVARLGECESEIEELNKRYEFKESEIKKLKQFYEEKIERQKKAQFEQKKEWTLTYNELFEELNFVKKDLENINLRSIKKQTFADRRNSHLN